MSEQATVEAIRKSVRVEAPIDAAFRTFTERFGEWWPVETHSLGKERAERATLEPREGGRIYESQTGGEEVEWGIVLAYEPPNRLVLAWGLNGSEVEIRFRAEDEATRVELEHRGWDRLEDKQERESYDGGWDVVLARYTGAAVA